MNHPDLSLIEKFNQYAGNPSYHVVTVIGSGMLDIGYSSDDLPPATKDHWIVWESPVFLKNNGVISKSAYEEFVQLKAFSWGNVKSNSLRPDITLKKFIRYIFGGFIATKIP